jgi:hypothetical protein
MPVHDHNDQAKREPPHRTSLVKSQGTAAMIIKMIIGPVHQQATANHNSTNTSLHGLGRKIENQSAPLVLYLQVTVTVEVQLYIDYHDLQSRRHIL